MQELKMVNAAAQLYNSVLKLAYRSLAKKERKNEAYVAKARKKQDRMFDVSIMLVNYANKKMQAANKNYRLNQVELDAAIEVLESQKKVQTV